MTTRPLITGILSGLLSVGAVLGSDRPAESPFGWVGDLDATRETSSKPILLVIDSPQQKWDRYIESAVLPDSALARLEQWPC